MQRSRTSHVDSGARARKWLVVAVAAAIAASALAAWAADDPDHRHDDRISIWSSDLQALRDLPDGQQRIERETARQQEYRRRWHAVHELIGGAHVSKKGQDLLAHRGLGPQLLAKDGAGMSVGPTADDPDTLKVLIVRISFETNRDPGESTISPDGDFMLEPLADPGPIEVDPPPHNRAYFESHLTGLSEYYKAQSSGRLVIEGEVLPRTDEGSYKLTDVADYGPGKGGSWMNHLDDLERLVQDMIRAADAGTQADGSVNLADFDDDNDFAYVIFVHAGSDWQSDVNDDSPNDIPTFFITLGESVDLARNDSQTGAPGSLGEVSVIPETTTQDGYVGSIAAGLYHEFGHALGLVDVYNTEYGTPNAGIWDLMDSGTNLPVSMLDVSAEGDSTVVTAVGVLPPSLGVWNKWFLGWLNLEETDGRADPYRLNPVWMPTDYSDSYDFNYYSLYGLNRSYPQALKVGVSSREFFLLENRWVPIFTDEFNPMPFNEMYLKKDLDTGVVLYLAGTSGSTTGNSAAYDFFLPDGGVLVWHVDMDRIEAGLADNTINTEWNGLRLVEADGIDDIGILDSYVLGWYGSTEDPFGDHNGYQDLYIDGVPHSRCFDRSYTGVELHNIQPYGVRSAKVMQLEASIAFGLPGFPWQVAPIEEDEAADTDGVPGPRGIDPASLTAFSYGEQGILVFADAAPDTVADAVQPAYDHFPAALYAVDAAGGPVWTPAPGRPDGSFLTLTAPLAGPPVLWEDGGLQRLTVGTRDGMVRTLMMPAGSSPLPQWTTDLGDALAYAPLALENPTSPRWLCTLSDDRVVLLDAEGNAAGTIFDVGASNGGSHSIVAAPVRLPLDAAGERVAVVHDTGWFVLSADGEILLDAAYEIAGGPLTHPVWTALVPDGDSLQLHIFDASGDRGAWRIENDGGVAGMTDRLDVDAPLVCEPAIADVDGDGRHDLILATADRLQAYSPGVTVAVGYPVVLADLFPLDAATRIAGPLIVADSNGDGAGEIFFQTDGGHLIGLEAGAELAEYTPFLWGDRGAAGLAVGERSEEGASPRQMWMVSAGGYTGPPLDRQYVNGRVFVRDLGETVDEDERTSEWLGTGGGALRRGPVGEPCSVNIRGLDDPAAAGAFLYPNPLRDDTVTLRFTAGPDGTARWSLYTLEGEEVDSGSQRADGGVINEIRIDLPGIASGMYVVRVEYPSAGGTETKTLTLAVER